MDVVYMETHKFFGDAATYSFARSLTLVIRNKYCPIASSSTMAAPSPSYDAAAAAALGTEPVFSSDDDE